MNIKTQKIISELSSDISRKIVFSCVEDPKSRQNIAKDTGLPLSTVYQKLPILTDLGLLKVDHIESTKKGRTIIFYKSKISKVKILITKEEPKLELIKN